MVEACAARARAPPWIVVSAASNRWCARRAGRWLTVLAIPALGCGGGGGGVSVDGDTAGADGGGVDAAGCATSNGPCWPIDGSHPAGTITLGTGYDAYEPMTDLVALVPTGQDPVNVRVHARMTGLAPGNATCLRDPFGPLTRFQAFFVDSGDPISPEQSGCALAIPYEPVGDGTTYELKMSSAVGFERSVSEDALIGTRIRIVAEIIDPGGGYARDERVVTCVQAVAGPDAAPGIDGS